MKTNKTARLEKRGALLRPAAGIAEALSDAVIEQIGLMARQTRREVFKALASGQAGLGQAMDDNPAAQARFVFSRLLDKWNQRFRRLAKEQVTRMIERTVRNSAVTLGLSLREASEDFKIDLTASNERLEAVISASTQEAAQLIRRIPQEYLSDVQGAVMRSITSGRGQADLVPYFERKYEGDVRWARHVALDQQRKAYSSINAVRLQALGVQTYIWRHTGGGRYPRKEHIAMSGKEFRLDDPPVIGEMYGQEVRGKPGDLPFCRCIMQPVFKFTDDHATEDRTQ